MKTNFYTILFSLSLISCAKTKKQEEPTLEMALPQKNGYALLIGMAKTDLPGYSNVFTRSARYNIEAMEKILLKNEFEKQCITKLHSPTADVIKLELQSQLTKLKEDDLFVFYFFGHGDQIPDTGIQDEKDYQDEVLITADRKLVDDEIYEILTSIKTRARVLFIVDACNSGSVYKLNLNFSQRFQPAYSIDYFESKQANEMELDFLYLGATQDGNYTTVSASTSLFTSTIESVLKDKSFQGSYVDYFNNISQAMRHKKIFPTLYTGYTSPQFLNQQPFKIN